MGHSRDMRGRLICDGCDEAARGTKTRTCEHGWCSADLCAKCVKTDPRWIGPDAHAACLASSARYKLDKVREAEALAAGELVRCAALGEWNPDGTRTGRVQVLFKDAAGATVGRWMPHECYDAFPLAQTVTLRQYQEHAGATFDHAPADLWPAAVQP